MKKYIIIFVLSICLFSAFTISCSEKNNGYGYSTTQSKNVEFQERKSEYQKRVDAKTMELYGLNGDYEGKVNVYKGEFDGHTWYIFRRRNSDESLGVIHDPNCKCLNNN